MAKFDLPDGVNGTVYGNAVYSIDKDTYKFGSGDSAKETIEWEKVKTVAISVAMDYGLARMEFPPKKGKGQFGFQAKWRVFYTDKGLEFKPDGKQPMILGTNKAEGEIAVAVAADTSESTPGDKRPFVELNFVTVVGYEDDGVQVGFQSGIGPNAAMTIGKNKATASSPMKLRIELSAEKPAEKRPVAKVPADLVNPDPVYFYCGEPTKDGLKTLNAWVNKVKEHDKGSLQAVIAMGDVPIELQPFASPKGEKKEAADMIARVKKDLQSSRCFGSSKLKFNEASAGKSREGHVKIGLDAGKASNAMDKLLNG